jgi:ElaB/YqjD/DUF883 family membrane-anchored ribosome-binding protein
MLMSDYRNEANVDFGRDGTGGPGDDLLNGADALEGDALERAGSGGDGRMKRPIRKAVGAVEAVVARTMGEPAARKVRDGAEAALGQAEAALGQAEGVYRSARFRVDRELANEPYKTLGIALGVGVVLGLLLARRDRTIIYRPTH